ncbi:hypothetical protein [Streptomyces gibsoniae]|uniref:Uncharacterized protein n=1 Tax=Streptomyces gibsoniae TaxID=3075529 RepID=A0ABU2TPU8_9ACTN|nr:hypothetical protein [Streptomyces sp. DSM 41699]MDT0462968.1 hypothetical protein [Streptomyces sp. DSM 41699]
MARPTDWDELDLSVDPTPGDPDQVRSLAQELQTLGDNARNISSAIDAVMNTAGDSVFVGAAADALRGKVDNRLRNHIADVASAFQTSGTALTTWAAKLEGFQATADGCLNSARGLAKDDPQRDTYKSQVNQVANDYEAAASDAMNGIMAVSGIALPISKCQVFWDTFQWLAVLLIVPALIFGGPLALLALGVNLTLFIKTIVDFANGNAGFLDIFMAGLGILAPTTKALPIFQIAKAAFGAVKGIGQFSREVFEELTTLFTSGFRFITLIPDLTDFVRLGTTWVRQGGLWTLESLHNVPAFAGMVFQRGALTVLNNFRGITGLVRGLPTTVGRGITAGWKGFGRGLNIGWNGLTDGVQAAWKLGVKEFGGGRWLRLLLPVDADEIGQFGLRGALRIGFIDRGLKGSYIFGAPIGAVGRGIGAAPLSPGPHGVTGNIDVPRIQLDDVRLGDWAGGAPGMRPSGLGGGLVDLTSTMRMSTFDMGGFGAIGDRVGLGFHAYRQIDSLADVSAARLGGLHFEGSTAALPGDGAGLGVSAASSSASSVHPSSLHLPGTAGVPAAQGLDLATGALTPGAAHSALTAVQTPPPGTVGHADLLLPGGAGGVGHGPGNVVTGGVQAFPGSTPPAALIVPATPGVGDGAHSALIGAHTPAPVSVDGHGLTAGFTPHGTAAGGPVPANGLGRVGNGGTEVSALGLLATGGRGTTVDPLPAAVGDRFGDRGASALVAGRTSLDLDELVHSTGSPRPGAISGTSTAGTAVPPVPERLTDVTPPTTDLTRAAALDLVETGPGLRPVDNQAFAGASAGSSAAGDADHAFAGASAGNSAAGGMDHAFAGAPARAGETPVPALDDLVGTPVRPDTAVNEPQVAHPAPHSVGDPAAGTTDTGLVMHHDLEVPDTSDLPGASIAPSKGKGRAVPDTPESADWHVTFDANVTLTDARRAWDDALDDFEAAEQRHLQGVGSSAHADGSGLAQSWDRFVRADMDRSLAEKHWTDTNGSPLPEVHDAEPRYGVLPGGSPLSRLLRGRREAPIPTGPEGVVRSVTLVPPASHVVIDGAKAGEATGRDVHVLIPTSRDLTVARWLQHPAEAERAFRTDMDALTAARSSATDDDLIKVLDTRIASLTDDLDLFRGLQSRRVWDDLRTPQVAALVMAERRGLRNLEVDRAALITKMRGGDWPWAKEYLPEGGVDHALDSLVDRVLDHLRTNMTLTVNVNLGKAAKDGGTVLDTMIRDDTVLLRNAWESTPEQTGYLFKARGPAEEALGYPATVKRTDMGSGNYPGRTGEPGELFAPTDLDRSLLPGYASLTSSHRPQALQQYGSAVFHLKPRVMERATFTPTDSFGQGPRGAEGVTGLGNMVPLLNHGPESLVRLAFAEATDFAFDVSYRGLRDSGDLPLRLQQYIEAQIHGRVTWQDLDRVVLFHDTAAPVMEQQAQVQRTVLEKFAQDHGFSFSVDTAPIPRRSRPGAAVPPSMDSAAGTGAGVHESFGDLHFTRGLLDEHGVPRADLLGADPEVPVASAGGSALPHTPAPVRGELSRETDLFHTVNLRLQQLGKPAVTRDEFLRAFDVVQDRLGGVADRSTVRALSEDVTAQVLGVEFPRLRGGTPSASAADDASVPMSVGGGSGSHQTPVARAGVDLTSLNDALDGHAVAASNLRQAESDLSQLAKGSVKVPEAERKVSVAVGKERSARSVLDGAVGDLIGSRNLSQVELNGLVDRLAGSGYVEQSLRLRAHGEDLDRFARTPQGAGRPDQGVWRGSEIDAQARSVRAQVGALERMLEPGSAAAHQEIGGLAEGLRGSAGRLRTMLDGFVTDAADLGGAYALRAEHGPLSLAADRFAHLVDDAVGAARPGEEVRLAEPFVVDKAVRGLTGPAADAGRRVRVAAAYKGVPEGKQWATVLPGADGKWTSVVGDFHNLTPVQRADFVKNLSRKNIEVLTKEFDTLVGKLGPEDAQALRDLRVHLQKLPYRVKHATPAYLTMANSGFMMSQGELDRRALKFLASGKSSVKNTSNLGNDDFVFFRMEVGDHAMQTRYGPTTVVYDADLLRERGGWVSLHDQLNPLDRPTMRNLEWEGRSVRTAAFDDGFTGTGERSRWTYTYPDKSTRSVSFEEEVFHGADVQEGLALSVVREVQAIGGDFKVHVLRVMGDSTELGKVVSDLFRPEAKFGGNLPFTRFGSRAHGRWPTPVTVHNAEGDGRYFADGTVDPIARAAGKLHDEALDRIRQADNGIASGHTGNVRFNLRKAEMHAQQSVDLTDQFRKAATGDRLVMAERLFTERSNLLNDIRHRLDPAGKEPSLSPLGDGEKSGTAIRRKPAVPKPKPGSAAKPVPSTLSPELDRAITEALPNATADMRQVIKVLSENDGRVTFEQFNGPNIQKAFGIGRNKVNDAIKAMPGHAYQNTRMNVIALSDDARALFLPAQDVPGPSSGTHTPGTGAPAGDTGLPHGRVSSSGTRHTEPGPGPHPLSPETDLLHAVQLRLSEMGHNLVDPEAVSTARRELELTGPAFTRADFRARADRIAAHIADREPGRLPGGAPGTTPNDPALHMSPGSGPGDPHAVASGGVGAGPSGLPGPVRIGHEFTGAPADFLRGRQVLLRMDEGLRTRTPGLRIDYGGFLHWMDRQDRHWFTLTPRTDADSAHAVYLLTPAIEKYAHEYAGDGRLAEILDGHELPALGSEGDYVAAHYVPYFQGESTDPETQIGHRTIPVERGGDFNPDLVFTGAMNGCAIAVTPERGGEAFTAWHYQSPTTNWSHSAKFRRERQPADWYGDAEYQSLGTSSYPETTNVLLRTDDGWHILSQENHSDLLNPKQSSLNRFQSRRLELSPGRGWAYRAGIYRRMAEEWKGRIESLENRRVFRLGRNPADLMLRSAVDLLKRQAQQDIDLLRGVTGNDRFMDVALQQARDHAETAHLVDEFVKRHHDEVKVEEAGNKGAWTWRKTSGNNSVLREQIIFDINDNLGLRWGDRLREEAEALRTPPATGFVRSGPAEADDLRPAAPGAPAGAGEPLPQVTPQDGHGPSGGQAGASRHLGPGPVPHPLSPEADLRHEVNLRLARMGRDPVGPEAVGTAHGELGQIRGAAFTRADLRARADEIASRIAGLDPVGLPGGARGALPDAAGVHASSGSESVGEPVAGPSVHADGLAPDGTPASAPEAGPVPGEVAAPPGAPGPTHEAPHGGTDAGTFPSPESVDGTPSRPSVLGEILGRRTEDAGLNDGGSAFGGDALPAPERVAELPPRPELIDQLVMGSDNRPAVAESGVPGAESSAATTDITTPSGDLGELVADFESRPALVEPTVPGDEPLTVTTDVATPSGHLDQGVRLTGANGLPTDGDRIVTTGPGGVHHVTDLDGDPVAGTVTDLGHGNGFRVTDETTGVSVRHDTLGRLQGTDVALADAHGARCGLFVAGVGGADVRVLTDVTGGPVPGRTLTALPDRAGFRVTDDATGVSVRYGADGGFREEAIALTDPATGQRGARFAVPDGAGHRLTDAAGTALDKRVTVLREGTGFRADTPTGYDTFGPDGAVTGDGLRLTGRDGVTGYVDRPLGGDPRWLDGNFAPDATRTAVLRRGGRVDLVSSDGSFQRFDHSGAHIADGIPLPNEPGGRVLATGHSGAGTTQGARRLEDRAGNVLTDWNATSREQGGVRFTYDRQGAPRHGEFLELDAAGTVVRQGFNVLDSGRPTRFRYDVDLAAGIWHRTDAQGGRQAPGLFHSGKIDRAGAANGRLRLLSSTKGAVPVFERRLLSGGDVLDAFRRTDTIQFGRTNPRTTWVRWGRDGEVRGFGTRYYDTAGTGWVDKGTHGAVREFREGLQKYDGPAGHILAERADDGSWTWHRHDGAARELGSGPRVRDRHDSGWTDRDGDGRIAQRQWGTGRLPEHQGHYQEWTLRSDGTLRDTWERQSAQGKDTGKREVFGDGRLTTERWSEQRSPLWVRNLIPGAGKPRHPYAHVAGDNGYQLFTWTKETEGGARPSGAGVEPSATRAEPSGTGAGPTAAGVESSVTRVDSGVRYVGMDGSTLDLRADGSFARSTTKLHDGTTLKVGDHARRPDYEGDGVPWQNGDRSGYRRTAQDAPGVVWADGFKDADGTYRVVREGLPGREVREYATPRTLGAPAGQGAWVTRDPHGSLTGLRHPDRAREGHHIVGAGPADSARWTWQRLDADGIERDSGRREFFRGSNDTQLPWDDSYRDYDATGSLVRERRMLDSGRYVDAWRDPADGRWLTAEYNRQGTRVATEREQIRTWWDGRAWQDRWTPGARRFRDHVSQPGPDGTPTTVVLRETPVHSGGPLRVREYARGQDVPVPYSVWKEYDHGTVVRQRVADNGGFVETDVWRGQWNRYAANGDLVAQRTDSGLVFERDSFGRLRLTGNEYDFRGPLTELRGWGRRIREAQRMPWSGTLLPGTPDVAGAAALREARYEPYLQSVARKAAVEFGQEFLLEFGANLAVNGIVEAVQGEPFTGKDALKSFANAAVGSSVKTGVSHLLHENRMAGFRHLGEYRAGFSNLDSGKHWNRRPGNHDKFWGNEWGGNENPTRWRSGTYDFVFGAGTSVLSGFVNGSMNAAVWGVTDADGNKVKLHGWAALGDGGINGLASLTTASATGLAKSVLMNSGGGRWFHRQGFADFWIQLPFKIFEKTIQSMYLTSVYRARIDPDWYKPQGPRPTPSSEDQGRR